MDSGSSPWGILDKMDFNSKRFKWERAFYMWAGMSVQDSSSREMGALVQMVPN